MKTDYGRLGRESLARLEQTAERAGETQALFLRRWLEENRSTEFGQRYGFSGMGGVEDYRAKVPLSSYSDYERDIKRIIAGERGILTERDAIYFCVSSGTVSDEKYLPLTAFDLEAHYIYMYGAVFGMIRDYYRELPDEAVFEKIFQIGEFARTHMPDGRMNGIRSVCVYQWLEETEGFDASDYCVPKEVLFPDVLEDMMYLKVRFALAERGLTAIHGVFINRVAYVVEYILQNWELLLRDMECGTVSVEIGARWRQLLLDRLPPDPIRAGELRRAGCQPDGIIQRIWKDMKYILAIGGESFSYYTGKVRQYAGDVPLHSFIYAASEGVFGLPEAVDQEDRYILLPESVFFEFLPIEGSGERTLLMDELEEGGRYELVVTNRSGLYRYRMGDVIEVVGWWKKAPVIKFCYRRNQVINIAGEKSNQQQLDRAIRCFAMRTHTEVRGYSVQEDMSGLAPKYLFYMECSGMPNHADSIFETCMCAANPEYRACRHMREIEPLHIEFLREGSFKRYERQLLLKGKPLAQCKTPRFLDTEEKRAFFAGQILKRKSDQGLS